MAKLEDIAKKCGVAISTVSLAINKPHKISLPVKEQILKVAHEMGYFQKKHPQLNRVLLVFNNFHDCYFGEYYNKVIFGILDSLYKEKVEIQILSDFNVAYSDVYENDGIIFVGYVPEEYLIKAEAFRIPYVLCGHPHHRPEHALRFDIERGVVELMDYVISCGHKRIGMIVGNFPSDGDDIGNALHNSFAQAFAKHKLKFSKKLVEIANFSNLQTVETALNHLLKAKPKPTAIFCTSDHFAYIAYSILKKMGVKIPKDISIVGFDGITTPLHLETPMPKLTTVATDQVLLGKESVATLKKIIINPNTPKNKILLPIQLSIGDSVQRL